MEAPATDSDPADAPGSGTLRASSLMRSINGNLRQLSEPSGDSEPIAFFCECEDPTCYLPVWMSGADFDSSAENRFAWLLVEGHEPSSLPAETQAARAE